MRTFARRLGLGKLLLRWFFEPMEAWRRRNLPDAGCRVTVGGLELEILSPRRNRVGEALYRHGVWEPEVTGAMRALVKPGMVVVDVGADIGYYTVLMAALAREGRVVAFEPLPVPRALLERNLATNDLHHVTVCDAALGREPGHSWITQPLELSRLDPRGQGPDDVAVAIRRFDDVARELRLARVDLIKIDVEGAEHEVLRGAIDTLDRYHPTLVVEVHGGLLPLFGSAPDDFVNWLEARGYRWRTLDGNPADTSTTFTLLFERADAFASEHDRPGFASSAPVHAEPDGRVMTA